MNFILPNLNFDNFTDKKIYSIFYHNIMIKLAKKLMFITLLSLNYRLEVIWAP